MAKQKSTDDHRAPEQWDATLGDIAEDFRAIVRLLNNPAACMSAPEVMDAIRLAGNDLARRMSELTHRMRGSAGTS